ncbi:protein phosphatase 2C [Pelomyxa schiedti]|nr:protein phosphatase 2C [Pelomyxa schiedti]
MSGLSSEDTKLGTQQQQPKHGNQLLIPIAQQKFEAQLRRRQFHLCLQLQGRQILRSFARELVRNKPVDPYSFGVEYFGAKAALDAQFSVRVQIPPLTPHSGKANQPQQTAARKYYRSRQLHPRSPHTQVFVVDLPTSFVAQTENPPTQETGPQGESSAKPPTPQKRPSSVGKQGPQAAKPPTPQSKPTLEQEPAALSHRKPSQEIQSQHPQDEGTMGSQAPNVPHSPHSSRIQSPHTVSPHNRQISPYPHQAVPLTPTAAPPLQLPKQLDVEGHRSTPTVEERPVQTLPSPHTSAEQSLSSRNKVPTQSPHRDASPHSPKTPHPKQTTISATNQVQPDVAPSKPQTPSHPLSRSVGVNAETKLPTGTPKSNRPATVASIVQQSASPSLITQNSRALPEEQDTGSHQPPLEQSVKAEGTAEVMENNNQTPQQPGTEKKLETLQKEDTPNQSNSGPEEQDRHINKGDKPRNGTRIATLPLQGVRGNISPGSARPDRPLAQKNNRKINSAPSSPHDLDVSTAPRAELILSHKKNRSTTKSTKIPFPPAPQDVALPNSGSGTLHTPEPNATATGCTKTGKRHAHNQDTFNIIVGSGATFALVCDGHSDSYASTYVAQNLYNHVTAVETFPQHPKQALEEGFKVTDEELAKQLKNADNVDKTCGTCVLAALILGKKLFIANLGDSRAVLCTSDTAVPLSVDHKASTPTEMARIVENGGKVQNQRLFGIMEVSRSLGDFELKKSPEYPPGCLSAVPEVTEHIITADDTFLILATDGVWNNVSNENAVQVVSNALKKDSNCKLAAEALVEYAVQHESTDDITAVVLLFHT